MAEAAKIVVQRKGIGTIPSTSSRPISVRAILPRLGQHGHHCALWCDGKRNLADVIRLTRLERGPVKFDSSATSNSCTQRLCGIEVMWDRPLACLCVYKHYFTFSWVSGLLCATTSTNPTMSPSCRLPAPGRKM